MLQLVALGQTRYEVTHDIHKNEIDKENMHLYLSLINTNQHLKRNIKLKETDKGFQTLKKMLPIWIKEVKFNKN